VQAVILNAADVSTWVGRLWWPTLRVADLFPGPEKTTTAVSSNQDLNQRTGYLYNYNFNIQHQLRPGLLIETGFIGLLSNDAKERRHAHNGGRLRAFDHFKHEHG